MTWNGKGIVLKKHGFFMKQMSLSTFLAKSLVQLEFPRGLFHVRYAKMWQKPVPEVHEDCAHGGGVSTLPLYLGMCRTM